MRKLRASGGFAMSVWSALVVFFIGAAIAGPLVLSAWLMRRRECPHCGETIEPDPAFARMMAGQ
jgi:hypothetical protein